MTDTAEPTTPLTPRAWLRGWCHVVRCARVALVPGVGMMEPAEVHAAHRAARDFYFAGNREGALVELAKVLGGETGPDSRLVQAEARNLLALVESLSKRPLAAGI